MGNRMDRLSRTAETDVPQLLPLNLLPVGLEGDVCFWNVMT